MWTHTRTRGYPPLSENIRVDVAIVGAGLSGIGAAYALKNSGLHTAVLESRTVASGASGRNAGFLLAGPAMLFSDAVGMLGSEDAQLLWGFTVENNETFAAIIAQYRIRCGFLRRGSISLAISNDEADELDRVHADLSQHGIETCPVSREFLPEPFDRVYEKGLYYPGNSELDPAAFLRGLADVVSESISIYEETKVLSLEHSGAWHLETDAGSVTADIVLLCTNALTNVLLPEVPIASTRGQVLATRVIPEVRVPFPMYADHGYQYWRQTSEGRLVIGGWRNIDFDAESTSDEELNPIVQSALDRFLALVCPDETDSVEYRWAGLMGFTPDRLPLVGRLSGRPGLYMAAGYSGHGVAMAFTCGSRLALTATGQAAVIPACLDPRRLITG